MKQNISIQPVAGLLANLLIALIGACALLLWSFGPDTYYLAVQEDEALEWSTFWAFIGAACIYIQVAARSRFSLKISWFPLGLALFCLFVALEEISWGQRVFGYRPPEYFLQYNFQQELNLHNILDTQLRKLSVIMVIFGYGVGLPLLNLISPVRQWFDRIGILSPPIALLPAFLLTGVSQQIYPIKFTGEWIEMMLGACFLFAALAESHSRQVTQPGTSTSLTVHITVAVIIVLAVGIASSIATNYQRNADPANIVAAQFELKALYHDFTSGRTRSQSCGFHRRIFTLTQKNGKANLYKGEFAQLVEQGLPAQRAGFFLDPWNYAYWIRSNCAVDGRPETIFLYSFGPNQRRDSTRWEIRGDDIAVVVDGAVDDFRTPVD